MRLCWSGHVCRSTYGPSRPIRPPLGSNRRPRGDLRATCPGYPASPAVLQLERSPPSVGIPRTGRPSQMQCMVSSPSTNRRHRFPPLLHRRHRFCRCVHRCLSCPCILQRCPRRCRRRRACIMQKAAFFPSRNPLRLLPQTDSPVAAANASSTLPTATSPHGSRGFGVLPHHLSR